MGTLRMHVRVLNKLGVSLGTTGRAMLRKLDERRVHESLRKEK